MFGTQLPRHFSMGSEVQREGILECQLYGDGLVVLTKGLQLWAVSGLAEPRNQKLASPRLKEPPSCMAIFQPRHTLSGCLEVCYIFVWLSRGDTSSLCGCLQVILLVCLAS